MGLILVRCHGIMDEHFCIPIHIGRSKDKQYMTTWTKNRISDRAGQQATNSHKLCYIEVDMYEIQMCI